MKFETLKGIHSIDRPLKPIDMETLNWLYENAEIINLMSEDCIHPLSSSRLVQRMWENLRGH